MKRFALPCSVVTFALVSIASAGGKLAIPSAGAYLGLWANPALSTSPEKTIEIREGTTAQGVGRTFALHLVYYQWTDISAQLSGSGVFQPDFTLAGDISHGRVPVISWKCDAAVANSNHVIAGGNAAEDAVITASAKALAQYPGPVILRWFWEFNQLNKNQSCRGDTGGAPTAQVYSDFIGAWQHIWTLFQKAGATNVVFLWNPGSYTTGAQEDPHGYYPGNPYVDWIGIDTYQRNTTGTFTGDFDLFYNDFSQSKYAGKPLMAGENGSFNYSMNNLETQAPYLQGVLAAMQNNRYPLLKAYDYFDGGGLDSKGNIANWVLDDNNGQGNGGLSELAVLGASPLFSPMPATAPSPSIITSISVCSPTGAGGAGSCPAGTSDTAQIVLAPNGASINAFAGDAISDEHSSAFSPGALGTNNDYLFFVASGTRSVPNPDIGALVLSGGSGPNASGQWAFDFARVDGYGSYPSGYGSVLLAPIAQGKCVAVSDPTRQDQTFDLDYAAPGSVIADPTGPPGSVLMIYEAVNSCVGSATSASPGAAYISAGVATSLDYGHTWPSYRGTTNFTFVPLPLASKTQGPNAPNGATGASVCKGTDCSSTPPASYGRYPVVSPPTSLTSLIAAGNLLSNSVFDSEMSAFVDDAAAMPQTYVYEVHRSSVTTDLGIARGMLNGGTTLLTFNKWDGSSFAAPGIGGNEIAFLPSGTFQNCGASGQSRTSGSIDYVETTQQYLLLFVCSSLGDPAAGPNNGGRLGSSWFFATSPALSDPSQWSTPQEVTGSWSPWDSSGGCPSYPGWYPTAMSLGAKTGHLTTTGFIFYLSGCEGGSSLNSPPPRRYSSRMFTIATSQICTPSFNIGGQAFPNTGGSVTVSVTAPANCSWSVGQLPAWITVAGASSGTGPGSVTLNVASNPGTDLSASINIGGALFTVDEEGTQAPIVNLAGSLAQVVSEGTWSFTLDAVNLGASTAFTRFQFAGNQGNPLLLPLTFPQSPSSSGPELAAILDRAIPPNAQIVMQSTGPVNVPVRAGSAQIRTNGNVSAFGIFSDPTFGWNALVPLETRNAAKYFLPFDNTVVPAANLAIAGTPLATGLAIANLTSSSANVSLTIRDDTGSVLGTGSVPLTALGHTSFMLNDPQVGYPVTANKRGTIEFDTPAGGQISVLGLRAFGIAALTTLPVLATGDSPGGALAQVAYNGGFTSTFYLVNTGSSASNFTLSFFDENGNPLSVPLTLPQSGTNTTTSALSQNLGPGATLVIETQANDAAPNAEGSARLTTGGSIGGFEIFRWTTASQEATVPLETRHPNSFILVYDNTNGLSTGVALSNLAAAQANIAVNIYDDTGALIETTVAPSLAVHGHTSFMLPDPSHYPITAGKRGMVEFVVPAGGSIGVIGLRAGPGSLTTIPVLAR